MLKTNERQQSKKRRVKRSERLTTSTRLSIAATVREGSSWSSSASASPDPLPRRTRHRLRPWYGVRSEQKAKRYVKKFMKKTESFFGDEDEETQNFLKTPPTSHPPSSQQQVESKLFLSLTLIVNFISSLSRCDDDGLRSSGDSVDSSALALSPKFRLHWLASARLERLSMSARVSVPLSSSAFAIETKKKCEKTKKKRERAQEFLELSEYFVEFAAVVLACLLTW